ncbi:competence protein ComEC [Dysgonomonas sp. PFB1-18]|uniref:ComEC/Rec2 family competence protein n=1 Tax=unclassified Dysgonomonas TaxID=2630389 RepID=UPI0024740DD4|nr:MULTISPECIES: ComEC/Rec2 family competence protein [unclassified Dysgonomonas]MDH6309776.1 competence protein ComEC [Dysgonomonas sp. PF1-14]MDH6339216.1 competence protein ComEC [Dysgonomonas sp. PF1-16]MDH6380715.1 competence protein ComEC [Dysgonomonas sp. PFB1-18]MDH6398211.1 competence protein ComEC [Dysgonomonas sp. PF1-23]
MKNPLAKIPFLFLLIPLLAGIAIQYYLGIDYLSIAFFSIGVMAMLLSYLIAEKYQFRFRWLFGAGAALFLIGMGIISTAFCQQRSEFTFVDEVRAYRGVVTDTPQEKPSTTAYRVYLPDEDKQIVCYFQRDTICDKQLTPGDEFLFQAKIQPFRNMGKPDDFDYVRYMYNQGFAGSAYVTNISWKATGNVSSSLKYTALRCRQQIMDFYRSLGFNHTEYSILSALTLGYQNDLTDDIKQGFRTTGTVHVLSVSGLHVGIIYLMISFLLGFIRRGTKYYWLKPGLIILLLWVYAFITGLPPSVIRASAMLTVFCASELFGKKSFSVHALYIAAFFMLLVNPFSLFDIGFQLSFMSVLSILYLQPKASGLIKIENKYVRNLWQMFTLSLVAQLATFPICLYYFGTFPTYFFAANLLIVPLVSFITYAVGGIGVARLLSLLLPDFSHYFYYLPVKILQILVKLMTSVIRFFESLPFALIDDVKISLADMVLIFVVILSFLAFFIYKKTRGLVVGLSAVLILLLTGIYNNTENSQNVVTVFNRRQATEIKWNEGHTENIIMSEDVGDYKLIKAGNNRVVVLSSDNWKDKETANRFDVSHLVLTGEEELSLYSLTQIFLPQMVVLDASLSSYTRRRLSKECQKLNIPCHDVVENGAYSLIF